MEIQENMILDILMLTQFIMLQIMLIEPNILELLQVVLVHPLIKVGELHISKFIMNSHAKVQIE